ncbi:MAG: hypothetical protein EKK62_11180 [Acidimicrobiia bacterium]|nr:MAG: hypothetical protein EKK62_11180 [Acidimicrobiia bacterium]
MRHEGFRFILDNGAWTSFTREEPWDESAFRVAMGKLAGDELCDGVVAPDIVMGGKESFRMSMGWLEEIREVTAGDVYLPVQPGITAEECRAPLASGRVSLFVGGDSRWKEETAASWARLAHEHGAKCHVGRVNSLRRLMIVKAAGADSFDGSGPSRFEKHLWEMDRFRRTPAQTVIPSLALVDLDEETIDEERARRLA